MTLVFLHIPKTGGSTLSKTILENYAAQERFDRHSFNGRILPLHEVDAADRARLQLVAGHYHYRQVAGLVSEDACFTVLRHPVERVLSHYLYVARGKYPGYEHVWEKGFEEYLDIEEEAWNFQTRMIAGPYTLAPDIDLAKRNLHAMAAVGITEMLPESLFVFAKTFGWTNIDYRSTNITADRLRRGELPALVLRKVERLNELDAELYDEARRLLIARLGALTASEREELAQYKRRVIGH